MRDYGFIRALMYLLASLALTLISCGGEGGDANLRNTGVGQAGQVSGSSGRTPVLRGISLTPSNPLGISVGRQLRFSATGSYSDNTVQDLTVMVIWTSSDTSVATVSNEPGSKGLVLAVSKGYCSISATFGNVSSSTVIGVN